MDKIDELLTRRVDKIYPSRKALEKKLRSGKKLKLYLGLDPTGNNLHLGHVIPLLKLKEFLALGHKVIFLVGNFTALCGDPSGHEEVRRGLTAAEIAKNMATYKKQAGKVLNFAEVEMKYNNDWLAKLTLKETIELAAHFTVQQNIERDLFQQRLKKRKPIYLHEFLYPLLQGYDSVAMNVDLEVGGTDQTFNMLAGRTLQKVYHQKEKFVLTCQMMLGTNGQIMSKTSGNTINILDSPKDKFGKVMSIIDPMIIHYFEFATNLPLAQLKKYENGLRSSRLDPMETKKKLAFEIVKLYHGEKAAQKAQEEFEERFQKKKALNPLGIRIKTGAMSLVEFLLHAGLASSKSEAKRLIRQNSVKILPPGSTDLSQAQVASLATKVKTGEIVKVGKLKVVKLTK